MVGTFSSSLNPLGSLFPKFLSHNHRTKPLSSTTLFRKALCQHTSPPTLRFSSVIVTGLATTTTTTTSPSSTVFDLATTCGACLPVVAKVASPPRITNAVSKIVVPEFCLALPKSRKKRRGGGGDGGMGDGNDGGDYFGFGGDGDEEDEENAKRWSMMWTVLCMYSAVQTIYFLLFGKAEEKHSGPLLATVTCSLCSRIQEKYLKKGSPHLRAT